MNIQKQEREILPLRYEIADIDRSITDARELTRWGDSVLRQVHPELEEQLYPEPTYNSEIYQQLGHRVDLLIDATSKLVSTENKRTATLLEASPIHAALLTRVPDMSWYRQEKPKYRSIPIDETDPRHNEPVVSLADYGVGSRAYYSRPNNATGEAVPGVKPEVFVRLTMAEKLEWVNQQLKRPEITEFFGGEVELFVDDGWRDPRLQKYLHDVVIPNKARPELMEMHPDLSQEDLEILVRQVSDDKIAWSPKTADDSPAPHETAGVADLALQYVGTGERIYFGRKPAQMVNRTDPDNFEHNPPVTKEDQLAAQNLYALYAIMRGTAFGEDTGLVPNPTEFWHWSIGDQLNYIVTGITPYYGYAPMNGVSTYDPQN